MIYYNENAGIVLDTLHIYLYCGQGKTGPHEYPEHPEAYKEIRGQVRDDYTGLPDSVSPHTFRRTRGTNLYRDGVELPVISLLLGHADIKTTRDHYASPSIEQLREALSKGTDSVPEAEPLWPDDEDEISRICGLD